MLLRAELVEERAVEGPPVSRALMTEEWSRGDYYLLGHVRAGP